MKKRNILIMIEFLEELKEKASHRWALDFYNRAQKEYKKLLLKNIGRLK